MREIASETIGERTARVRVRRGLTQEQLADAAAVSVDLVRKLEQNQRRSTRIGTLHALARALRVQTSVLIDAPFPEDVDRPGPGIVGLRHALTPGTRAPDVEPPSADELRIAIGQAWMLHQRGDYESSACVLPSLIEEVRAASREHPGDAASSLLAEIYHLAAVLLLGVGAFGRIDRLAPGWLPYQGIAHEIVRGMLRRGSRTSELRRFAARLDLQA